MNKTGIAAQMSEQQDCNVISDPHRVPITCQRIDGARVLIRTPGRPVLIFSESELDRLFTFVRNEPQLGRLQRFPAPAATQSDELPPLLKACPGLPVSGSTNATGA
jgi:hypothetical protein